MKTEYKIKENGFDEMKRKIVVKTTLIMIFAVIIGLVISYLNINTEKNELGILAVTIPIAIIAITIGIIKGVKKQKKISESYKLTITDKEIIREQVDTEPNIIPFDEIKSIEKNSKDWIIITGKKIINPIIIPAQIDNKIKLEQELNNIMAIKPMNIEKTNSIKANNLLIILIFIASLVTMFISSNNIVMITSGIISILILVYLIYVIQMSKNIDKKTKKIKWWLIFFVFFLITQIYFKFIGKA